MSMDADSLLLAKLNDCIAKTSNKSIPTYLGFLNEHEFSVCKTVLDKNGIKYAFSGGFDNAARVVISLLPDWTDEPDYPFTCLKFEYKSEFSLTHRDFLGTVMSLGIERDKVGDIIIKPGTAFVFISSSVSDFVKGQISKVGGVGVKTTITNMPSIDIELEFEEIRKTVASNRADCVVGALCNMSRESANSFILSGYLFVNQCECKNNSFRIKNGDVLSLRGYGKYYVVEIDVPTKKGRMILKCEKCI